MANQVTGPETAESESKCVSQAVQAISQRFYFQAIQYADSGLESFPSSKRLLELKAKALMESGDLDAARKILEGICGVNQDEGALGDLFGVRALSHLSRIVLMFVAAHGQKSQSKTLSRKNIFR
jgi:hypothetical protein